MVQQNKIKRSEDVCQRFLTKLSNPKSLSGAEIWRLYKGDGSGEGISTEIIENFFKDKSISLDREGFDKIFVEETETSLKKLKHVRQEYTQLIKICTQLKQVYHVPPTNDQFKYNYELDTVKHVARYKEGKYDYCIYNSI